MDNEVNDFLAHYGVPGMKWGKRKSKSDAVVHPRAAGYTDRMAKSDNKYHGKKAEAQVNQKVAEGKTLAKARTEVANEKYARDMKLKAIVGISAYVAVMYGPTILDVASRSLNTAVLNKRTSNGKKYAEKMFAEKRSQSHGLSTGPTIRLHQNPATGNWV